LKLIRFRCYQLWTNFKNELDNRIDTFIKQDSSGLLT